MLSLSPRFDQFKFQIPTDYIPDVLVTKYNRILTATSGVITDSMDYLNESIQGVSLPGITDLVVEQPQVSHNTSTRRQGLGGRIDVEAHHPNSTLSPENPITKIDKEFTVIFRQNQGLYNYWMMYETIFHRYCRDVSYSNDHEVFDIVFLDENSRKSCKLMLYQPQIKSIDGLEFSYNKVERDTSSFNVVFSFNNVDFDFIPQEKEDL